MGLFSILAHLIDRDDAVLKQIVCGFRQLLKHLLFLATVFICWHLATDEEMIRQGNSSDDL